MRIPLNAGEGELSRNEFCGDNIGVGVGNGVA